MAAPSFVHLRLHSEYSIADGIVRIDDAVRRAAADGMPAVALTDLGNLFGLVKFYKAARAAGVKPVVGCDVWISHDSDPEKPSRALLLCRSHAGYLRLCALLTRAWLENQHRGRAELRREWLREDSEGLIMLSGAHQGEVGQALLQDNRAAALRAAREWAEIFPDAFYLEVQRAGHGGAEACLRHSVVLAAELGLPMVATHPVQFLDPDDFKAHEARVCIAEGYMLGDRRRPRHFTPEQYFRSQAEMAALFADLPEALANSVEIARRCNFSVALGKPELPRFPTPQGVSLDQYLEHRAQEGLHRRLAQLYPDAAERERQAPRYRERLAFETATIVQMGFAGYFLIVADFINWAKSGDEPVPVGPGRGSGAGSLVAYSLGITDLDPLRYDLLFERFLNPERVSMPDFDIDFCQDGRERVIDYVRRKYGEASVSQIATFGTMAARAVVRDVGRVLDLSYNFVDQLAKLIPGELGMTLAKARQQEPQLNERAAKEEEVAELLELAEKLEGVTRNVGMHAGGVLIAPGRLSDFCPLYCAEGGAPVSQYDKDDVESVGLVKFDFLGLTTLTILDWTERLIRAGGDPGFSLAGIPLDDKAAFELLSAGNTTAVFQLESRGMKDLIKRARPDRFEDVIALVALYRPGPMDLIPDFIDRKHGRQRVEYLDPRLEQILGQTYGIMVYQEQVMQIAQVIGGYTLGGADLLRRAMGKKKAEEMAKHRDIFVKGAQERGLARDKASHLFDLMEKFAGYGFNKSHAAAYALLAYQTAYLKAHHPAAFMAANLSAVMDDTDKVRIFYEDAVASGLAILPPDINRSGYRFVPVDAHTIRYGLGAVKGTGQSAIDAVLAARGEGPFADLFDLCARVDKRVVNRRAIESLIRAGAFDALDDHRARLLASVGAAMELAEQANAAACQSSLFGEAETAAAIPAILADVPRWPEKDKLASEKAAIGFYLSGHPYDGYAPELEGMRLMPLDALAPQQQPVTLAGVVSAARTQMTRRGKMAFVTLEDGRAQVEVSVFSEIYDAHRDRLREDQLVVVEGKVLHDDYTGGIRVVADRVFDLAAARAHFARGVLLTCNGQAQARRLMEILAPYRDGSCPVWLHYRNERAVCDLELGEGWRVQLREELLQSLADWLSRENVRVLYGQ